MAHGDLHSADGSTDQAAAIARYPSELANLLGLDAPPHLNGLRWELPTLIGLHRAEPSSALTTAAGCRYGAD